MKIVSAKPHHQAEWAVLRNNLWPYTVHKHLCDLENYFSGKDTDIVQAFLLTDCSEELTGFIELNIRTEAPGSAGQRVPFIEGWYIEENIRRCGFGAMLVRQAESWAKSLRFGMLASDTDTCNNISISAHKALGFTETDVPGFFIKRICA